MKKAFLFILILCITLTGCQKTPEKSSVVSKSGGLSQDVIAPTLKDDEYRHIDVPEQWTASEKRSNDRVLLTVDIPMEPVTVSNLPVLEVQNHAMSESELQRLVDHFAGGKTLYAPNVYTKADYQWLKERIDKGEGAYGDTVATSLFDIMSKELEQAIQIAPGELPEKQAIEVEFQSKFKDEAFHVARGEETITEESKKIFFEADVGEECESHIEAKQYDAESGISSQFLWNTGGVLVSEELIRVMRAYVSRDYAMGEYATKYTVEFNDRIELLCRFMDKEGIDSKQGQKQAEKVLEDLGITDMKMLSVQKTIYFPKGEIRTPDLGLDFDNIWQADFEKGKQGYEYTFTRAIGGLSIDQMGLSTVYKTDANVYAPPFDIEKITIVVTEDGVQSFNWNGMCGEAGTVAENVNLLSFDEIQEYLFEQIFYEYTSKGQPSNDKTKFTYSVIDAKLGYTYIPAYEAPNHAWLVPAWFFSVEEYVDASESTIGGTYENQQSEFMINAIDGNKIAKIVQ